MPFDYLIGIGIFLITLTLYLHTLMPTIGLHDSGDMAAAAYIGGISHPTGYPFYCIFGKLWSTLCPLGSIGFRMNLFSSISASLTCMLLFFILQMVTWEEGRGNPSFWIRALSGMMASFVLASVEVFWTQAVIAEKYTLNALFVALNIFLLLKYREWQKMAYKKANRYLYLLAFTLGLAFTHHLQSIYLIPGSILFIIIGSWQMRPKVTKKSGKNKRSTSSIFLLNLQQIPQKLYRVKYFSPHPYILLKMIMFFILPLFLWLYLPIRAMNHPVMNWNSPSTIEGFINHITALGYRALFASPSLEKLCVTISHQLPALYVKEFILYTPFLGMIGLVCMCRFRLSLFCLFGFILFINLYYAVGYSIPNIEDYYIPSFLIFSLAIGYSIFVGSKGIKMLFPNKCARDGLVKLAEVRGKEIPNKWANFLTALLFLGGFLGVGIQIGSHYHQNNMSKNWYVADFITNMLKPLEEDAIILPVSDYMLFPLWYFEYVERYREDVNPAVLSYMPLDWVPEGIKDRNSDLIFPFEPLKALSSEEIEQAKNNRINTLVTKNFNKYPIYFESPPDCIDRTVVTFIPEGFFLRAINVGLPFNILRKQLDKSYISFPFRDDPKNYRDWRTELLLQYYPECYKSRADFYYQLGAFDEAVSEYDKAVKLYNRNPEVNKEKLVHLHNLLAGIYFHNKNSYPLAIYHCKQIAILTPNNTENLTHLGSLYYNTKQYLQAQTVFERILELEPNNEKAEEMVGLIREKM